MRKIITLGLIALFLFFIIQYWWNNQLSPVSSDQSTKTIVIEKGESFSQIAEDFKKQNLIRSIWAFSLYAKQTGLSAKIQAGTFRLSSSMSSEQILQILTSQPLESRVTLLEGWRVEEMASKLNHDLGINSADFLQTAKEGYMFPDTYFFPKEYTASQIAKTMRDNFNQKYSLKLRSKIRALGLTDTQGVILASIVEREARSDSARKMVASILLKRFKVGMRLDADSTIQYALVAKGTQNPPADGWWKNEITADDKEIDSPYNTYLHVGFPPTPICNPGLSSLNAVANADPLTPYLYYYHDSKGVPHYAETLEEQNQNVANYP